VFELVQFSLDLESAVDGFLVLFVVGGDYNTAECGFDGGDCGRFNLLYIQTVQVNVEYPHLGWTLDMPVVILAPLQPSQLRL
jgi:hypothetical protein